ncbi:hypothetical protein OPT61_g5020 [Boeremia exigua]|uniref:Uncharacterized protein n=1 Tax=Boeremia exigua TaxID=749465 RepID=A0ACC2IBY9_9PLEO|nr:hypothetical protein OPT61_g5020 [Boeremia exigua]
MRADGSMLHGAEVKTASCIDYNTKEPYELDIKYITCFDDYTLDKAMQEGAIPVVAKDIKHIYAVTESLQWVVADIMSRSSTTAIHVIDMRLNHSLSKYIQHGPYHPQTQGNLIDNYVRSLALCTQSMAFQSTRRC